MRIPPDVRRLPSPRLHATFPIIIFIQILTCGWFLATLSFLTDVGLAKAFRSGGMLVWRIHNSRAGFPSFTTMKRLRTTEATVHCVDMESKQGQKATTTPTKLPPQPYFEVDSFFSRIFAPRGHLFSWYEKCTFLAPIDFPQRFFQNMGKIKALD